MESGSRGFLLHPPFFRNQSPTSHPPHTHTPPLSPQGKEYKELLPLGVVLSQISSVLVFLYCPTTHTQDATDHAR